MTISTAVAPSKRCAQPSEVAGMQPGIIRDDGPFGALAQRVDRGAPPGLCGGR